jgi:peptidoglycan/xylan/chitin deacetylase (PgdA/CDA1 family)
MLRQHYSVLMIYFLGYSRVRNLIFRLQRKPVSSFVTFHDIPPETLGRFKDYLYFLKRSANVVSLDDFFSGRLSSKIINVVITFDDGYKSWITSAAPVLRKLELPATFFISSGFVGLSKEDGIEFMRSKLAIEVGTRKTLGLNFKDVRKIVEEGFTVGGHTLNHCNLAELQNSAQLRHEIVEDKKKLESITGRKIEYFAYPSGAYQNPVMDVGKVLKEAGYRGAVTTVSGFNSVDTNPYQLHRELTGVPMPGRVFRARVYGNYEGVRFLKYWIRMVLQRRLQTF